MVCTGDLDNCTMLIQLRCEMNRRVKGAHVEQGEKNTNVETTID